MGAPEGLVLVPVRASCSEEEVVHLGAPLASLCLPAGAFLLGLHLGLGRGLGGVDQYGEVRSATSCCFHCVPGSCLFCLHAVVSLASVTEHRLQ